MQYKKNILILGSDGYLGQILNSKFNSNLFDIDNYDLYPKSTQTLKLDVKNNNEVIKIIKNKKYDVVISLVGVLPGKSRKNKLYNENLSAVSFLKNIKTPFHFIFCSSVAIYDNKKFEKQIVEKPFEIYGKSKFDCESIIKNHASSYTIFRIGTMVSKDRQGGIMHILNRLKKGKLTWLPDGGRNTHPFVDVDDVADAIIYACTNSAHGTYDLIASNRESIYNLAIQLNPKQRIKSFKLLDLLSNYIGFDNYPIVGISKWHLNALKYDLPISREVNLWKFTNLKSMKEAIINSLI